MTDEDRGGRCQSILNKFSGNLMSTVSPNFSKTVGFPSVNLIMRVCLL